MLCQIKLSFNNIQQSYHSNKDKFGSTEHLLTAYLFDEIVKTRIELISLFIVGR